MACRCRGMSSAACCTPRVRCVPKMCCGLRCRRRGPTAVYKPSCKYSNYLLLELKRTQQSVGMENMLLVKGGQIRAHTHTHSVILPGCVVTASEESVIARRVRKEICGMESSHLKSRGVPAEPCHSHTVSRAGLS